MLIGRSISMQLSRQRKSIVKDGLKIWLEGEDFTNSPPTSLLRDRSGNGNNATPSGMAYTTVSGSDGNGGIVFDGVDDRALIAESLTNLSITNQITCEVIIDKCLGTGSQAIVSTGSYTGGFSIYLRHSAGADVMAYFNYGNNTYTFDFAIGTLDYNVPNHLCVTFIDNVIKLYINGVFVGLGSTVIAIATNWSNLYIGYTVNVLARLNGTVKKLRMYNRALTDAEILQNYNATK